jgi:hypothetical protein
VLFWEPFYALAASPHKSPKRQQGKSQSIPRWRFGLVFFFKEPKPRGNFIGRFRWIGGILPIFRVKSAGSWLKTPFPLLLQETAT